MLTVYSKMGSLYIYIYMELFHPYKWPKMNRFHWGMFTPISRVSGDPMLISLVSGAHFRRDFGVGILTDWWTTDFVFSILLQVGVYGREHRFSRDS